MILASLRQNISKTLGKDTCPDIKCLENHLLHPTCWPEGITQASAFLLMSKCFFSHTIVFLSGKYTDVWVHLELLWQHTLEWAIYKLHKSEKYVIQCHSTRSGVGKGCLYGWLYSCCRLHGGRESTPQGLCKTVDPINNHPYNHTDSSWQSTYWTENLNRFYL